MEKYDLKRAIVTVTEKSKLKSHRDDIRLIKIYQKGIEDLPQPIDRKTNKKYLEYQYEIQKCRSRMRQNRVQRFFFDVFVKQYNTVVVIEWTFTHYELGASYQKEFRNMLKEVVNMAIKRVRTDRKAEPRVVAWFGNFTTQFLGIKKAKDRVFFKPGEVLRIYCEKNLASLYEDKKPVEQRKYIGIELEFCAPIKENQFAIKLFRSGIHKFAQLKKDLSLRPQDGETGYELAILLEESNYKKRLKQLTNLLTEVKAVALDRRAGLHVHLDMRRRDKDLVYNNLVACQYALLSVVNPLRVDNEFCRIVNSRKFPTEFTGQRDERYKTINAAAFYKYKTLEVRMHEGSVDYNQISSWVDLLIRIANYGKKIKDDVTKVTVLKKRVALDEKLFAYMQDRSCYWQLNNNTGNMNIHQRLQRLAEIEERNIQLRAAQDQMRDQPRIVPIVPTPRAADDVMHQGERLLGLNELLNLTAPVTTGNVGTALGAGYNVTFTHTAGVPEELNPEPDDFEFDDDQDVPF